MKSARELAQQVVSVVHSVDQWNSGAPYKSELRNAVAEVESVLLAESSTRYLAGDRVICPTPDEQEGTVIRSVRLTSRLVMVYVALDSGAEVVYDQAYLCRL